MCLFLFLFLLLSVSFLSSSVSLPLLGTFCSTSFECIAKSADCGSSRGRSDPSRCESLQRGQPSSIIDGRHRTNSASNSASLARTLSHSVSHSISLFARLTIYRIYLYISFPFSSPSCLLPPSLLYCVLYCMSLCNSFHPSIEISCRRPSIGSSTFTSKKLIPTTEYVSIQFNSFLLKTLSNSPR